MPKMAEVGLHYSSCSDVLYKDSELAKGASLLKEPAVLSGSGLRGVRCIWHKAMK